MGNDASVELASQPREGMIELQIAEPFEPVTPDVFGAAGA